MQSKSLWSKEHRFFGTGPKFRLFWTGLELRYLYFEHASQLNGCAVDLESMELFQIPYFRNETAETCVCDDERNKAQTSPPLTSPFSTLS